VYILLLQCFDAVGRQEGYPVCKNGGMVEVGTG